MKSPYCVRRRWVVPGLVEELGEGEELRAGFGIAFRRWQRLNAVSAVVPLHLVISTSIALWVAIRFRIPLWLDRRCRVIARPVHEAFVEGWERGAAAAREDMFAREDAVRRLRAETLAGLARADRREHEAWNHAAELVGALEFAVSVLETMKCEHGEHAATACEHRAALSRARLTLRLSDLQPEIRDRLAERRARSEPA